MRDEKWTAPVRCGPLVRRQRLEKQRMERNFEFRISTFHSRLTFYEGGIGKEGAYVLRVTKVVLGRVVLTHYEGRVGWDGVYDFHKRRIV